MGILDVVVKKTTTDWRDKRLSKLLYKEASKKLHRCADGATVGICDFELMCAAACIESGKSNSVRRIAHNGELWSTFQYGNKTYMLKLEEDYQKLKDGVYSLADVYKYYRHNTSVGELQIVCKNHKGVIRNFPVFLQAYTATGVEL